MFAGRHRLVLALLATLICVAGSALAQGAGKGLTIQQMEGNAGKRWAICIGINNYEESGILDLEKARADAEAVAEVMGSEGQFDRVYLMTDAADPRGADYPKLRNVTARLDFLQNFIQPEDLVVFFFSGHGVSDEEGNGYLVMADAYVGDLFASSLPVDTVVDWLTATGVKKSILLLDACREYFQLNKGINNRGLRSDKYENAEVAAVFYATKSGWYSFEDSESRYGVFTRFVVEGLRGSADDRRYAGNADGIVTFTELSRFVEESVTEWALDHNRRQMPYTRLIGERYGDLALSSWMSAATGSLVILSNVEGAEVTVGGESVGSIRGGRLELNELAEGLVEVHVSHPQHKTVQSRVQIAAGKTVERRLHSELRNVRVTIETRPEGASVYMDDVYLGLGPVDIDGVTQGSHTVETKMNGYLTSTLELTIEDPIDIRKTIVLAKEVALGHLIVKSNMVNGDVSVDGVSKGRISNGSLEIRDLTPGRSTVRISHRDFKNAVALIEIVADRSTSIVVDGEFRAVALTIESSPRGASVYVGGSYKGKTPLTLQSVEQGQYSIECVLDGYENSVRRITVSGSDDVKESFELARVAVAQRPTATGGMTKVPGGTFTMGSSQGYDIEMPEHAVSLSAFRISIYEVTQREWEALMGYNPSAFRGEELPVHQITWYEAVEFCNQKSKAENLNPAYVLEGLSVRWDSSADGYRLPTEAEWEYAARGGGTGSARNYPGGSKPEDLAWFAGNSQNEPHEVGQKRPNALSLYDMAGNVAEWCWDWFESYGRSARNPQGPATGTRRVARGGAWGSHDDDLRVTNRGSMPPELSHATVGFRVARNDE